MLQRRVSGADAGGNFALRLHADRESVRRRAVRASHGAGPRPPLQCSGLQFLQLEKLAVSCKCELLLLQQRLNRVSVPVLRRSFDCTHPPTRGGVRGRPARVRPTRAVLLCSYLYV